MEALENPSQLKGKYYVLYISLVSIEDCSSWTCRNNAGERISALRDLAWPRVDIQSAVFGPSLKRKLSPRQGSLMSSTVSQNQVMIDPEPSTHPSYPWSTVHSIHSMMRDDLKVNGVALLWPHSSAQNVHTALKLSPSTSSTPENKIKDHFSFCLLPPCQTI